MGLNNLGVQYSTVRFTSGKTDCTCRSKFLTNALTNWTLLTEVTNLENYNMQREAIITISKMSVHVHSYFA